MILIGLGANLPSPEFGDPENTLEAALRLLADQGVAVRRRSRWYATPPVPPSDQPWYVNGVASVTTALAPTALLQVLHRMERRLGRTRRTRWEARVVDLDLLAYGDRVIAGSGSGSGSGSGIGGDGGVGLSLPHPRMHQRPFVLVPLAEVASAWRHPITGKTANEMLAELPGENQIRPRGGKSRSSGRGTS